MAKKRITARQKAARKKNIEIARRHKKKGSKKKKPSAAAQRSIDALRSGKMPKRRKASKAFSKLLHSM